jgi:predicted house-cleaning noncanonical NTP pyrophosphatase (MazG superfamily)
MVKAIRIAVEANCAVLTNICDCFTITCNYSYIKFINRIMLPVLFEACKKVFGLYHQKSTEVKTIHSSEIQIFRCSEIIHGILMESENALTIDEILVKLKIKLSPEICETLVSECLEELVISKEIIELKDKYNDSTFGINKSLILETNFAMWLQAQREEHNSK